MITKNCRFVGFPISLRPGQNIKLLLHYVGAPSDANKFTFESEWTDVPDGGGADVPGSTASTIIESDTDTILVDSPSAGYTRNVTLITITRPSYIGTNDTSYFTIRREGYGFFFPECFQNPGYDSVLGTQYTILEVTDTIGWRLYTDGDRDTWLQAGVDTVLTPGFYCDIYTWEADGTYLVNNIPAYRSSSVGYRETSKVGGYCLPPPRSARILTYDSDTKTGTIVLCENLINYINAYMQAGVSTILDIAPMMPLTNTPTDPALPNLLSASEIGQSGLIYGSLFNQFSYRRFPYNPATDVLDPTKEIQPWKFQTAYEIDDRVIPVLFPGTQRSYKCTTAGTSGTSEPVWPNSGTVNDGTVVWTYEKTWSGNPIRSKIRSRHPGMFIWPVVTNVAGIATSTTFSMPEQSTPPVIVPYPSSLQPLTVGWMSKDDSDRLTVCSTMVYNTSTNDAYMVFARMKNDNPNDIYWDIQEISGLDPATSPTSSFEGGTAIDYLNNKVYLVGRPVSTDPNQVMVSDDWGVTWTSYYDPTDDYPSGANQIRFLQCDAAGNVLFTLKNTDSGVYTCKLVVNGVITEDVPDVDTDFDHYLQILDHTDDNRWYISHYRIDSAQATQAYTAYTDDIFADPIVWTEMDLTGTAGDYVSVLQSICDMPKGIGLDGDKMAIIANYQLNTAIASAMRWRKYFRFSQDESIQIACGNASPSHLADTYQSRSLRTEGGYIIDAQNRNKGILYNGKIYLGDKFDWVVSAQSINVDQYSIGWWAVKFY